MKTVLALVLAAVPLGAAAENYLGVLRAPAHSLQPNGLYSFASGPSPFSKGLSPFTALTPDSPQRLKLGYKYSRYFAVEGEVSETSRPANVFSNPANLSSAFRSTGFALDTVATLPVWRFSFYGRMGAYRGDRSGFNHYSTALLGENVSRGTRWRYGLGVRYDFTKSLRMRAELERYSSLGLGQPFAGDADSDQITVGVSWRF